jgi:hypothetical protein
LKLGISNFNNGVLKKYMGAITMFIKILLRVNNIAENREQQFWEFRQQTRGYQNY